MGKPERTYLKFDGIDWDNDEAIDAFAKSLHSSLVDRMDPNREFRSQERDEKEVVHILYVLCINFSFSSPPLPSPFSLSPFFPSV